MATAEEVVETDGTPAGARARPDTAGEGGGNIPR